jgi:hypothetical protein
VQRIVPLPLQGVGQTHNQGGVADYLADADRQRTATVRSEGDVVQRVLRNRFAEEQHEVRAILAGIVEGRTV